ncbi:MAG: hypothetical protein RL768_2997 [Nitrospirota bacterium]|jgi:hypothetical protein
MSFLPRLFMPVIVGLLVFLGEGGSAFANLTAPEWYKQCHQG